MNPGKETGASKVCLNLLVIIMLVGCERGEYDAPEEQAVYFEYHYVNHAWG